MQQVMKNAASLISNMYVLDQSDKHMITVPTDENGHLHLQGDAIDLFYRSTDVHSTKSIYLFPLRIPQKIKCLKRRL